MFAAKVKEKTSTKGNSSKKQNSLNQNNSFNYQSSTSGSVAKPFASESVNNVYPISPKSPLAFNNNNSVQMMACARAIATGARRYTIANKNAFTNNNSVLPAVARQAAHNLPRLVQRLPNSRANQKAALSLKPIEVQRIAGKGVQGTGQPLPYFNKIQKAFGHHDISNVKAYLGANAANASRTIGASAYATGNKIAFANNRPDLHTTVHEAAHIIQQRAGVHLKGGIGETGDKYEQQADKVANQVVQGKSVERLLT